MGGDIGWLQGWRTFRTRSSDKKRHSQRLNLNGLCATCSQYNNVVGMWMWIINLHYWSTVYTEPDIRSATEGWQWEMITLELMKRERLHRLRNGCSCDAWTGRKTVVKTYLSYTSKFNCTKKYVRGASQLYEKRTSDNLNWYVAIIMWFVQ